MAPSELQDLIVVEVPGSIAGAYCAKVFADRGAHVMLAGTSTLADHQSLYLHPNKTRCELDAIDWSTVDVLIESSAPDPLTPLPLADSEHLVRVQISPFASSGPYATWKSTDLVDYAMSGHSYLYGHPDREPLRGPPHQPAVASGLFGFIGAMAALFARERLGHGQTVDVSHMQVMVALHQVTLLRWQMSQSVARRLGNRYTGPGQPNGPYPCKDGWVSIACVTTPQAEALLAVTGLTHLMDHPDISSPLDFQSHPHVLDEPLNEWLLTQTVDDVVELFQAMRIPTCPLRSPLELLDDPQLIAREFFEPLPGTNAKAPRSPFTMSHRQPRSDEFPTWQPGTDLGVDDGPLTGLRVLDLARVWAGPLCARILSDLGAEVVWVEAPWSRGPSEVPQSVLDAAMYFAASESGERQWNRNTHFVKYSLGKQSLALDLQSEAGRAAFERLVPQFDVLLENFSTRVMPQFGLGEGRLHELHPGLIYLTMPGYGRSGPAENWLAYGSTVDSHAGLSNLIGYADESPWKGGVAWPDPVAGLHACCAVLVALWSGSQNDSSGLTIEAAQFESTVAAIGDQIVEAQLVGPAVPNGNRQAGFVAQGVYRCRDNASTSGDAWIAVSVPDADALAALSTVIGAELSGDDHDQLDEIVSSWASERDAMDLAHELQAAGIAAGPILIAPSLLADPHLAARNAWVTVDQPDVGVFTAPLTPIRLSHSSITVRAPAPTFGQHNHQVLAAAGFATEEIASLFEQGVIVDAPPG